MPTFSSSLLLLPVATVEDLLHPSQYYDAVRTATASTTSRLTIWVETALLSSHQLNAITQWTPLQSFLGKLYGESSRVAQGLGRVLFEVEVVLEGAERGRCPGMKRWEGRSEAWDIVWRLDGGDATDASLSLPALPQLSHALPWTPRASSGGFSLHSDSSKEESYPTVVLGGSFDHLHSGHKILLTMAILLASRKVIVGVSDDSLLTKKAYADQLESLQDRCEGVRRFMRLIDPSLEYDVVPIQDVYGPTATESDIQALVLSQETVAGGDAIASLRASKSLPALEVYTISVISHSTDDDLDERDAAFMKEAKMSSTAIRKYLSELGGGS